MHCTDGCALFEPLRVPFGAGSNSASLFSLCTSTRRSVWAYPVQLFTFSVIVSVQQGPGLWGTLSLGQTLHLQPTADIVICYGDIKILPVLLAVAE
jgi:hypothetical protein